MKDLPPSADDDKDETEGIAIARRERAATKPLLAKIRAAVEDAKRRNPKLRARVESGEPPPAWAKAKLRHEFFGWDPPGADEFATEEDRRTHLNRLAVDEVLDRASNGDEQARATLATLAAVVQGTAIVRTGLSPTAQIVRVVKRLRSMLGRTSDEGPRSFATDVALRQLRRLDSRFASITKQAVWEDAAEANAKGEGVHGFASRLMNRAGIRAAFGGKGGGGEVKPASLRRSVQRKRR